MIYDSETKKSIQCMGMDFLLGKEFSCLTNKKEQRYEEEFACISSVVNGRPALIFTVTVMYPNDYEALIRKMKYEFLETAKKFNTKGDLDLYLVGIGLINKDESRQDCFKIGDKYRVCIGSFVLISPSNDSNLGLTIENAVQLSAIDEEYYFIDRLIAKKGMIVKTDREGSIGSPVSNGLIDEWTITTISNDPVPLVFKYPLYIDAYTELDVENEALRNMAFFNLDIE
ncbi:MAG: hypothetical protein E7648_01575 [Ruminococcaceae bacterium]|nr:hypothetical protein [Oscillospiraceae bacterium]